MLWVMDDFAAESVAEALPGKGGQSLLGVAGGQSTVTKLLAMEML
jgi:hypothetical protein